MLIWRYLYLVSKKKVVKKLELGLNNSKISENGINREIKTLEKTNYYDNWSKEYKEKIWRNKW